MVLHERQLQENKHSKDKQAQVILICKGCTQKSKMISKVHSNENKQF